MYDIEVIKSQSLGTEKTFQEKFMFATNVLNTTSQSETFLRA